MSDKKRVKATGSRLAEAILEFKGNRVVFEPKYEPQRLLYDLYPQFLVVKRDVKLVRAWAWQVEWLQALFHRSISLVCSWHPVRYRLNDSHLDT